MRHLLSLLAFRVAAKAQELWPDSASRTFPSGISSHEPSFLVLFCLIVSPSPLEYSAAGIGCPFRKPKRLIQVPATDRHCLFRAHTGNATRPKHPITTYNTLSAANARSSRANHKRCAENATGPRAGKSAYLDRFAQTRKSGFQYPLTTGGKARAR